MIVFLVFSPEMYVGGVFIALILCMVLVLSSLIFFLQKFGIFVFYPSSFNVDKKRVLSFLKYMTVGGISSVFFGYIDTIMLGIFVASDFVGYYSAAFALIASVSFFLSFSVITLPAFTQLKKHQLKNAFNRVFRYMGILTLPMIFGSIAIGRYMIKLIYGYEYLPASVPFYFLSPLIFSISLTSILVSLFSAREEPRYFVKMLFVSAILNIILNYTSISIFAKISPMYAVIGVAIATLISRYFYMIALGVVAKKITKIEIRLFDLTKPVVASLVMFFILIKLMDYLQDINLFNGALIILSGMFVYFGVLFLIKGIEKQDIRLLKILKNKFYC